MAALFLVGIFVALLLTDILVRKIQTNRQEATAEISAGEENALPFNLNYENVALPGGLFFHKGHTWAKLEPSGNVQVGVDDFAQKIIGKIDNISLRKVGETVYRGEKFFTIKQGRRQAIFTSPVDGMIESSNEEIEGDPMMLKDDPYEKGWVYSVKPTNLNDNIKFLSVAEEAKIWLKNEVQRFKEFIAEQFVNDKMIGKSLADGGVPVDGVMEHMDDFSWMKLQDEFLTK